MFFKKQKLNLDNVSISAPCPIKWDMMEGSKTVRNCSSCQQTVFNISEMTRKEAEEVLASNTESLCLRLYRRADGTLITKDCPLGIRLRDRVQFKIQTIVASFLALIHAVPAFGQAVDGVSKPTEKSIFQVEPYVLDGGIRPASVERQPKTSPTIPETWQPNRAALDAYDEAKRFETTKDLKNANEAYERALGEFRTNIHCTFDPVFKYEVATRYAKFLRKQRDRKKAQSIELEFRLKQKSK